MSDILVEVAEAVPVEVNLPAKDNAIEMEVYYQDEVSLDTDLSLLYIKSGEKEIENYVENVSKPEINDYIETYAKPIVSEVVDNIASPIIDEYFEETVKPSITEFANKEMAGYAETATTQAGIATAAAIEANATSQSVDAKVAEFSEQTEASKQEFIAFAGEKTEEFEQTAQQATADSQANVEKSRIWAEGEQAEVKPLGGELSSMGAADLAYALANAPEDTPIDASGLFAMNVVKGEKGDKGDKGDKGTDGKDGVDGKDGLDTFATNCITEIPQDIKLEIDSNGKCWLKAGSKCYKPNGTVINIVNDVAVGRTTTAQEFIGVSADGSRVALNVHPSRCYSGTTAPTGFSGYGLWLDTNSMTYKYSTDGGSTWTAGDYSLPIALVTMKNVAGEVSSIDQVFNGFGYIGSTVFALPSVKGLIPNGRNADGSLKNVEFVTDKVLTYTNPYGQQSVYLITDGEQLVLAGKGWTHYNSERNTLVDDLTGSDFSTCVYGMADTQSDNKIISFTPKQAFHAVDRNDSSWIAQQAMPSNKYIDLTLGATDSTYTAPANGWFALGKASTASGQFISIRNNNTLLGTTLFSSASGQTLRVLQQCMKGDKILIGYSAAGSTAVFRFIYAGGEN